MIGQEISLSFSEVQGADSRANRAPMTFCLGTSAFHKETEVLVIRTALLASGCELNRRQMIHLRDFLSYCIERKPL